MRICILLTLCIAATGCYETHPDRDRPVGFVTEILRVEAVPNPVIVGDTLRLKCVIKDSLKSGFEYSWFVVGMGRIKTDVPTLSLKVNQAPGKYTFSVLVLGRNPDHFDPTLHFEITVIEKE
jgi:hypothetical protein